MIEFQNKQDVTKILVWFRTHMTLPKALLLQVQVDTESDDTAANIIKVSFGGMFYVTFVGTTISLEDICRSHDDLHSAQAVRGMIASFMMREDTVVFKDGTLWDELDRELKENMYAFATYFR